MAVLEAAGGTAHVLGVSSGGMFAVEAAIPDAVRVRLPDQGHVVDPAAFAPVLGAFLRGEPPPG